MEVLVNFIFASEKIAVYEHEYFVKIVLIMNIYIFLLKIFSSIKVQV